MHHFGIDLPDHSVKMAAQQPPRHSDSAGRKGRDLARRLQRDGIDRGSFDYLIDDAGFPRLDAASGISASFKNGVVKVASAEATT
jgi:hypothetical protein